MVSLTTTIFGNFKCDITEDIDMSLFFKFLIALLLAYSAFFYGDNLLYAVSTLVVSVCVYVVAGSYLEIQGAYPFYYFNELLHFKEHSGLS
jgi:hypothetical protein